MKLDRPLVQRTLRWLRDRRWVVLACLVSLSMILTSSWIVSLATQPVRHTAQRVDLGAYGIPRVELGITYPTRLSSSAAEQEALITISARALQPDAVAPIEITLALPNDAVAFLDLQGRHTSGRLTITPGYPDALPFDVRVAHGNTQLQGGLMRAYGVQVLPLIRTSGQAVAIPELAFEIRLTSLLERAVRDFSVSLVAVAAPYLLVAVLLAVAGWVTLQLSRRQRLRREKLLATRHSRLREHIKLQHWSDARNEIERLRLERPHYRDIDQLDTIVSAAETAAWRREQLYQAGLRAYKERDWPSAVQSFAAVEQETPYYRDVRFVRRTAALYADLASRDRSRRIDAARELGEVADLVDMQPLLEALGDPSSEVVEAARTSLRTIGVAATDDLLACLLHERPCVREGVYSLIEQLGQSAREPLVAALHSSNPEMTRQAALLLATLGARKQLSDALLWATEPHLPGIVAALQQEGNAAASILIETLLQAPANRQQLLINALAALKGSSDADHRLEEALRAARSPQDKALLQRALAAEPASFAVPPLASSAPPPPQQPSPSPQQALVEPARTSRAFWRARPSQRIEAPRSSPSQQRPSRND